MARAQASRQYRSRVKKVIDQGSLAQPPDGFLAASSAASEKISPADGDAPAERPAPTTWRCCRCSRCCPDFFRWDFLRRRAPRSIAQRDKRGAGGDHPPLMPKRKSCATTMSRSGVSERSPVSCIFITTPWPGSWPRLACRAMDSRQGRRKPIPICPSSARRLKSSPR